jgi:hypothetical protein
MKGAACLSPLEAMPHHARGNVLKFLGKVGCGGSQPPIPNSISVATTAKVSFDHSERLCPSGSRGWLGPVSAPVIRWRRNIRNIRNIRNR